MDCLGVNNAHESSPMEEYEKIVLAFKTIAVTTTRPQDRQSDRAGDTQVFL